MKKIIKFPSMKAENREYSEETFEWLADRAKEYIDFLTRNAPKKDKSEWSMCKLLERTEAGAIGAWNKRI